MIGSDLWPKKKLIITLRWLIIIIISYLIIFGRSSILLFSGSSLLIFMFIASNIFFYFLPKRFFMSPNFDYLMLIADTALISLGLFLTGQARTDFYLVYFLIIILATLGRNLIEIVGNAIIICIVYGILFLKVEDISGSYGAFLLLRIPFIFIIAFFYGTFVEKVKREQLTARRLAEEKTDMENILAISQTIASTLEMRHILAVIMEKIKENIKGIDCSILLFRKDNNEPYLVQEKEKDEVEYSIVNLSDYPELEKALSERKLLRIPDVYQSPLLVDVSDRLTKEKVVSLLVIPLMFEDRVMGALYLKSINHPSFVTPREISFYQVVANSAASALKNAQIFEEAKQQSITDELTGLYNHRHFQSLLKAEVERSKRNDQPLSIFMIDIDNLKLVNDNFGHASGDTVLQRVGSLLVKATRYSDIHARYGGDEFICLLPNAGLREAYKVASRLCIDIHREFKNTFYNITASIGVATFPASTNNPSDLIRLVDQAMYLAKHNGGNQVKSIEIDEIKDLKSWNLKTLEAFISVMSKRHFQTGEELADRVREKLRGVFNEERIPKEIYSTVASLVAAVDAKDHYTHGHSHKVVEYAIAIANRLRLPAPEVEKIGLAASLHDIGKIGVPESALLTSKRLNQNERSLVEQHPVIGVKILEPIHAFREILPLVKHHHENWDGSGYPDGLKEDDILLGAQIISLADVFHALTSQRPYRKALTFDQALQVLKEGAGKKWKKELVDIFIDILEQDRKLSPQESPIKRNKETFPSSSEGVE